VNAGSSAAEAVANSLRRRRSGVGGLIFEVGLVVSLLAALGILATLLAEVIQGAVPVFQDRGWGFIRGPLTLSSDTAGVWLGIVGSLTIAALVALLAFPIGIGAAIYLEEYAADTRFTRFVTTNIRNLAGVPSIVYGLLGLAVFVRLVDGIDGAQRNGRSVVAAGLTMAVLVLPIVIITASEAIRAVPGTIREAGLAVGATRWEVIRHHVLPAAAPGVLTGTILTLSRAFGESAPLLLIGVTTGLLTIPKGIGILDRLLGGYTALPVQVFTYARQPGDLQDHVAPAAIVVLLVVLLGVNAIAIVLRNRWEQRW